MCSILCATEKKWPPLSRLSTQGTASLTLEYLYDFYNTLNLFK